MNLKNIFAKPVDRPIEGVIKADDEAGIRLELEEYVLTNEVEKRLEFFLDAYNNYEGANGVWVSGFFGSGKSHLLKILALVLENREIDGIPAINIFLPKCGDNEILRGELKRAIATPSKSILFNIDQKADVISKTQVDALLAVFIKVFDEMCGYYGKQPYIAQFERDLNRDGLWENFQNEFKSLAGKSWEWGRSRPTRVGSSIDAAYNKVTGQSQTEILDKYRQDYHLSIEDFADQVNDYVKSKGPNFRLNFYVDEVGQYIADNVKLMTNLQTIAESLATKCRGRAWVIVTAQEEMGAVVGEMGQKQGNDFSKIQARFATRMKLTSADVAEVIQKRLLMKNGEGIRLLSDTYRQQSNNFKTLFDFADGSKTYKNFRDKDHFIRSYPFIPYQFALFQSAIQNLSDHNAFEGKHSSVGERSMLGVFQQVAMQISDYEVGKLATFDLMFEGIRTALVSSIQRAIIQAENHLNDKFAIRLLKALFLVKYVKEFKPTLRNTCVLMLEGFNKDLPTLRSKVEEALNRLENETYIQRNGELYEFLTDEEKDVEQEIKNTEVETGDVANELEKIVYDHVIKHKKIRYDDNGQDYAFSRRLDDKLHGREYELSINVITPFHEGFDSQSAIAAKSTANHSELLVLMPTDDRLVRDLLMYKRTDKYIRQNVSVTQQDEIKRILSDKSYQNQERYADIQAMTKALLSKANLYVAGSEIEIISEDAQSRVVRAFNDLISRTYSNLRMLRGVNYSEDQIRTILSTHQGTLEGMDTTSLSESEQELFAYIQSNSRGGVRTTLKSLLERFEHRPYGWYYSAILCILANLCARGKIEARSNGDLLEDSDLEKALRNTHGHANVILDPQIEFSQSQIRVLKEFFEDFFDSPPRNKEAKPLGKETADAIKALLDQLYIIQAQAGKYPFLKTIIPALEILKEASVKPYTWYLTELVRHEDKFLDLKEKCIDPIRKFMSENSQQRAIYDNATSLVKEHQPNFSYIEGNEAEEIVATLNDPECFKGNRIQQLKTQLESLQKKVNSQIEGEIDKAQNVAKSLKYRLFNMPDFSKLRPEQQAQLQEPFEDIYREIKEQQLIAVIRDKLRTFEEEIYQKLLSQLTEWTNSPLQPSLDVSSDSAQPRIEFIPMRSVQVNFNKAWLSDETDVDDYLSSMKKAMLEEIQNGKRIQI